MVYYIITAKTKNFESEETEMNKMYLITGAAGFLGGTVCRANSIAGIMEKKAKKKGEKPVMTSFSVYNLARNNTFDSSKARYELGYTTRSYRKTIHDEIVWLKAEKKIS